MTSPATGADGAAGLPDYAPIPRSALGPPLNDQGCYVGRVERPGRALPPPDADGSVGQASNLSRQFPAQEGH